jgi:hypothetical protein
MSTTAAPTVTAMAANNAVAIMSDRGVPVGGFQLALTAVSWLSAAPS